MHALILLCINQYTKFEEPGFTNYRYMVETDIWLRFNFKNALRDSDHAHFSGG